MNAPPVPPQGLRPMADFDPTQPASLHDCLNDQMRPWTGGSAADWRASSKLQSDGTVFWDELVYDGWAEALGG